MGITELDEQVGPLSTLRPNIERKFGLKDPSSYVRASVNIFLNPVASYYLARTNFYIHTQALSMACYHPVISTGLAFDSDHVSDMA